MKSASRSIQIYRNWICDNDRTYACCLLRCSWSSALARDSLIPSCPSTTSSYRTWSISRTFDRKNWATTSKLFRWLMSSSLLRRCLSRTWSCWTTSCWPMSTNFPVSILASAASLRASYPAYRIADFLTPHRWSSGFWCDQSDPGTNSFSTGLNLPAWWWMSLFPASKIEQNRFDLSRDRSAPESFCERRLGRRTEDVWNSATSCARRSCGRSRASVSWSPTRLSGRTSACHPLIRIDECLCNSTWSWSPGWRPKG